MKRKDIMLVSVVLALVSVVAGLRIVRARATSVVAAPGAADSARKLSPDSVIPRLVDLGARRCIPCRKMAPILAELRSEYAGRADVVFIDVWEQRDLADGYQFRAIPTQIFYDGHGREAWRHEGFLDKPEIVAQFRRLGVK